MTYKVLEDLGLKYDVIDVVENPNALQHVKELGYMAAPVVVPSFDKIVTDAEGKRIVHWAGFRPDLLNQLKPVPATV